MKLEQIIKISEITWQSNPTCYKIKGGFQDLMGERKRIFSPTVSEIVIGCDMDFKYPPPLEIGTGH